MACTAAAAQAGDVEWAQELMDLNEDMLCRVLGGVCKDAKGLSNWVGLLQLLHVSAVSKAMRRLVARTETDFDGDFVPDSGNTEEANDGTLSSAVVREQGGRVARRIPSAGFLRVNPRTNEPGGMKIGRFRRPAGFADTGCDMRLVRLRPQQDTNVCPHGPIVRTVPDSDHASCLKGGIVAVVVRARAPVGPVRFRDGLLRHTTSVEANRITAELRAQLDAHEWVPCAARFDTARTMAVLGCFSAGLKPQLYDYHHVLDSWSKTAHTHVTSMHDVQGYMNSNEYRYDRKDLSCVVGTVDAYGHYYGKTHPEQGMSVRIYMPRLDTFDAFGYPHVDGARLTAEINNYHLQQGVPETRGAQAHKTSCVDFFLTKLRERPSPNATQAGGGSWTRVEQLPESPADFAALPAEEARERAGLMDAAFAAMQRSSHNLRWSVPGGGRGRYEVPTSWLLFRHIPDSEGWLGVELENSRGDPFYTACAAVLVPSDALLSCAHGPVVDYAAEAPGWDARYSGSVDKLECVGRGDPVQGYLSPPAGAAGAVVAERLGWATPGDRWMHDMAARASVVAHACGGGENHVKMRQLLWHLPENAVPRRAFAGEEDLKRCAEMGDLLATVYGESSAIRGRQVSMSRRGGSTPRSFFWHLNVCLTRAARLWRARQEEAHTMRASRERRLAAASQPDPRTLEERQSAQVLVVRSIMDDDASKYEDPESYERRLFMARRLLEEIRRQLRRKNEGLDYEDPVAAIERAERAAKEAEEAAAAQEREEELAARVEARMGRKRRQAAEAADHNIRRTNMELSASTRAGRVAPGHDGNDQTAAEELHDDSVATAAELAAELGDNRSAVHDDPDDREFSSKRARKQPVQKRARPAAAPAAAAGAAGPSFAPARTVREQASMRAVVAGCDGPVPPSVLATLRRFGYEV